MKKQKTEKMNKFEKRLKTSCFIVLYTFVVLILGMLASYKNPWFDLKNDTNKIVFSVLFALSYLWLVFLCLKELNKAFFSKYNQNLFLIQSLLYYSVVVLNICLVLAILYSNTNNLIFIFWITNISLFLINLIFDFVFVYKNKNSNFFHKSKILKCFLYLFTKNMICYFFVWFFYITTIKFWLSTLLLIMITFSMDSFAYVGGITCGKHKMSPVISPKKTWEGFAIGLILSVGILLALLFLYKINEQIFISFFGRYEIKNINLNSLIYIDIAILFVLCIVDVYGDLYFSLVKRIVKIKDYSNMLGEHGGILDRIDAMIFIFNTYGMICLITSISNDYTTNLLFGF